MKITVRDYKMLKDFNKVGDFLIKHYISHNLDGNFYQPTWEYMHTHPCTPLSQIHKIGIWEFNDEIVGIVNFELEEGEVFFQIHPDYTYLKKEMLDYAEENLYAFNEDGKKYLNVMVNDFDTDLINLLKEKKYNFAYNSFETEYTISEKLPEIVLPDGFKLISLEDENDLSKIHSVLWRGFDHDGEPPLEGIDGRRQMQSGPNFRKDLTIVAKAPNGDYASFCGMWYEPINCIAYIEPLATDPKYRKMGLGKAVVIESITRCAKLGAITVIGGSNKLYFDLGFENYYKKELWSKTFDNM